MTDEQKQLDQASTDGMRSPPETVEQEIQRKGLTAIDIARICHEANRALCQAFGDHTQPKWDDAPEWQHESAVSGVKFHHDNPGAGPEASHENWSREKLAAGWQWGPTKDPERKLHPCLVQFNALPVEQQAKDHIFRAIVHAAVLTADER